MAKAKKTKKSKKTLKKALPASKAKRQKKAAKPTKAQKALLKKALSEQNPRLEAMSLVRDWIDRQYEDFEDRSATEIGEVLSDLAGYDDAVLLQHLPDATPILIPAIREEITGLLDNYGDSSIAEYCEDPEIFE